MCFAAAPPWPWPEACARDWPGWKGAQAPADWRALWFQELGLLGAGAVGAAGPETGPASLHACSDVEKGSNRRVNTGQDAGRVGAGRAGSTGARSVDTARWGGQAPRPKPCCSGQPGGGRASGLGPHPTPQHRPGPAGHPGVWGGQPGSRGAGRGGQGLGDICESVVLKESEQIVVAVGGEVGRAQVGQQLVRVGQFREQVQSWFRGLPRPRHAGGPHHACGGIERQLAGGPRVHLAQGLPGCWRVWMVQLGTCGTSEVRGVQPWWPRVVGWVQVAHWCHLAWETGSRLLWRQEAAGNVRLVGDGGWPWGELSKGGGAGRGRWKRLGEGSGPQEAGTCEKRVRSWGGWGGRPAVAAGTHRGSSTVTEVTLGTRALSLLTDGELTRGQSWEWRPAPVRCPRGTGRGRGLRPDTAVQESGPASGCSVWRRLCARHAAATLTVPGEDTGLQTSVTCRGHLKPRLGGQYSPWPG